MADIALARVLEKIEKGDQDQADDHPQCEIPEIRVHSPSLRRSRLLAPIRPYGFGNLK
jgi:hypothetical protein